MNIQRATRAVGLPRAVRAWTLAALMLAGCGGGVGTGGTGSYAQGPINGFGSVIVNDVRYDDTSAQVLDADGNLRSRDDLKLGMTVQIDSSAISTGSSGSSATATKIVYESEMLGALAAIDTAAAQLTLLGQTVQVDSTTVFDDSLAGGLAALSPGQLLKVYASFDPAGNRYRATRVEPAAAAASYQLRGPLSQLDSGNKTFHIGGAVFAYGNASGTPALANGVFVRMNLQPASAGSTHWAVLSFGSAGLPPPDGASAKVKGLISAFSSNGSFSVNGQVVAAGNASFSGGTSLGLGVRVEVEGTVQGGELQATRVTLLSDQAEQQHGFELHGAITALDPVAQTFTLRGVVVAYGSGVVFKGGTLLDLKLNVQVEVKGTLSGDGTRLDASEIQFDD